MDQIYLFIRSFIVLVLISASAAAQTDPDSPNSTDRESNNPQDVNTDGEEVWRSELAYLADRYRAANRMKMADQVAGWEISTADDRDLLYLPDLAISKKVSLDNDDPIDVSFLRLRERRAESLWLKAQAAAESGEIAFAFRLMHHVLREDPQHELARHALSRLEPGGATRISKGTGREKRLGWPAGRYWRSQSAHFSIITNAGRDDAAAIANLFESYHSAWRQLFLTHWSSDRDVKAVFDGRPLRSPGRRRHQVVLFADRQEFIRTLRPLEPRIEMATGVYRDKDRTTYLYVGDASLQSTWIHELTHQLFQESTATRLDVAAESNFWIVEAIAMYCESVKFFNGYCIVGGWESARLQTARYRQRNEKFYLPLAELSELTKSQLQTHTDIRRLYTESAGLAHFFMDGRRSEYQDRFVQLVSRLYRQPGESFRLWESLGVPSHRLDEQYAEFLDVCNADLESLRDVDRVHQLSLGFTQVTDQGLQYLRSAKNLQWLDLSALRVTDTGLEAIRDCTSLERLTLAGTLVTDAGLAHFSGFHDLEELDLSGTRITDSGLEQIVRNHPRLKSLWLSDTQVSAAGVQSLAELSGLTELDVDGTRINASEWRDLKREFFPRLAGVDRKSNAP